MRHAGRMPVTVASVRVHSVPYAKYYPRILGLVYSLVAEVADFSNVQIIC
jgi:hypothetical protein